MEQMNIGNLFIEMGYGANTVGKSQYTPSTYLNGAFKNTLNEMQISSEISNCSSKNNYSKDSFKPQVKEYAKKTNVDGVRDKKVDSDEADLKKDKTKRCTHESNMFMLVSQNLNLTVDEIKETLQKLGLKIEDLKGQEAFGSFIGEICGQENMIELLTNAENLKNISMLFEQLNALQGEPFTEASQVLIQENGVALEEKEETEVSQVEELKQNSSISTQKEEGFQVNERKVELNDESIHVNQEAPDQSLNLFQEQMHQENGVGISISNLSTTFTQTFQTEAGLVTQTATRNMISGETLIDQVDFKMLGQTKEINLQLSPKELGDLSIKIVENNSALVAEIKVDSEKTKELILSEMHHLKENLENQGLTISDMKVDIRQSHQQSQMEQGRQKSSKRIQEIISKQLDTLEEEDISIQITSEIDYMV